MSDEKKHSAEYAAKMVLKKAYDMLKSERYTRASGVKGVHPSSRRADMKGTSMAGQSNRIRLAADAKSRHKKVLNEMKDQPKPDLPKSEKQSLEKKKKDFSTKDAVQDIHTDTKEVHDVLRETPKGKKDDVLRELRDSKDKKKAKMKKSEKLQAFVVKMAEKRGKNG